MDITLYVNKLCVCFALIVVSFWQISASWFLLYTECHNIVQNVILLSIWILCESLFRKSSEFLKAVEHFSPVSRMPCSALAVRPKTQIWSCTNTFIFHRYSENPSKMWSTYFHKMYSILFLITDSRPLNMQQFELCPWDN